MFRDTSRNRVMILLFYLFLVAGLIFIYLFPKPELFLKLYSFHTDVLNVLMKILTFLGNGIASVIVVLILFFRKLREGFFIAFSAGLAGLVTQLLKIFVFPGYNRPVKYFSDMGISLDTVPGVPVHYFHSFPSGHTATAFAVWFGLSLWVKDIYLKIFLFVLAVCIGYSRIYLGQHFPSDVLGGAVVGGISAMVSLRYTKGWKKKWLELPLTSLRRS